MRKIWLTAAILCLCFLWCLEKQSLKVTQTWLWALPFLFLYCLQCFEREKVWRLWKHGCEHCHFVSVLFAVLSERKSLKGVKTWPRALPFCVCTVCNVLREKSLKGVKMWLCLWALPFCVCTLCSALNKVLRSENMVLWALPFCVCTIYGAFSKAGMCGGSVHYICEFHSQQMLCLFGGILLIFSQSNSEYYHGKSALVLWSQSQLLIVCPIKGLTWADILCSPWPSDRSSYDEWCCAISTMAWEWSPCQFDQVFFPLMVCVGFPVFLSCVGSERLCSLKQINSIIIVKSVLVQRKEGEIRVPPCPDCGILVVMQSAIQRLPWCPVITCASSRGVSVLPIRYVCNGTSQHFYSFVNPPHWVCTVLHFSALLFFCQSSPLGVYSVADTLLWFLVVCRKVTHGCSF